MNLFLPYATDIEGSVRCLDDKRLLKQILETKLMLDIAEGKNSNYKAHPVVKYYVKYPKFLARYGFVCCEEYTYRFNKIHKYMNYFKSRLNNILYLTYTPAYLETTVDLNGIKVSNMVVDNVSKLYQYKLIQKWDNDTMKNNNPKWTNREIPNFYKDSKKTVCCICGKSFSGYGNNPYPLSIEGRCCDVCNTKVVAARFAKLADNKIVK